MHRAAQARAGFWDKILPGQIPGSPVSSQALYAGRRWGQGVPIACGNAARVSMLCVWRLTRDRNTSS